ncbi:MAG: hypothetical protein WB952_21290 [Terriglobales bacterium]
MKVRELGRLWASSALRPGLTSETKKHWDSLIRAWADSDLPLVVRRSSSVRGGEVIHISGRRIVSSDNSPAQWVFSRAFAGCAYSLSEIEQLLERDQIPFTMVAKVCDKAQMRFKCTLASADNVNKFGWKLCHIEPVGLKTKGRLEDMEIQDLTRQFCRLLKPSNHFLVPLDWAGLGEMPEVIEEISKYENSGLA